MGKIILHSNSIGVFAAALASTFFGGMVFATRFVIDQTDPISLAFARFAIGSTFLAPAPALAGWQWGDAAPRDLPRIGALGVIGFAVMSSLLGIGLQSVEASEAALILASQSLITLVLSIARREEHLSILKLIGISSVAAGIGLGLNYPSGNLGHPEAVSSGWLAVFGAALCVSIYNVYSRPFLKRYPPLVFTATTTLACAMTLAPIAVGIVVVRGFPPLTPLGWTAVFYIGTFGAAFGYALWVWALQRTTPSRVAVCLGLNPFVAAMLGAVFLHEVLTPRFFAGLILVIGGIVVMNY